MAADADIEKLIALHADRAYSIALRMTGNESDAADIAQESFLRVLKYMKSYDSSQPFEAWLGQIVRNVYLNSLRLEARRRSVPLSVVSDDEDALSLEETLADPAPGPEREAESRCEQDSVQKALEKLSPNLRMTVILIDLEGMGREDCAQMMGCSLSALDVHLHRGRARLKEILS